MQAQELDDEAAEAAVPATAVENETMLEDVQEDRFGEPQKKTTTISEFKRSIAERSVQPHIHRQNNSSRKRQKTVDENNEITNDDANEAAKSTDGATRNNPVAVCGMIENPHILAENKDRTPIACFLCLMRNSKNKRSTCGCVACQKAHHVDCFAAHHHQSAMDGHNDCIANMVTSVVKMPRTKKTPKHTGSLETVKLSDEEQN